jgi:hypothetical protein
VPTDRSLFDANLYHDFLRLRSDLLRDAANEWFSEIVPKAAQQESGRAAQTKTPLEKQSTEGKSESGSAGLTDASEGRHSLRRRFWEQLLARAKQNGFLLHENRTPGEELWLNTGAGRAGFQWTYLIWKEESGVELYLDNHDESVNRTVFKWLRSRREAIETSFGAPLDWDQKEGRRATRIRYTSADGGLDHEHSWPTIQANMIDTMQRLHGTIGPLLLEASAQISIG